MTEVKSLPVKTYRVRYIFEGELTSCAAKEEVSKDYITRRFVKHMPSVEKTLGMNIIKEDFISDVTLKETLEKDYHRYIISFTLEAEETMDGVSEEEIKEKANNKIKKVIGKVDELLGT